MGLRLAGSILLFGCGRLRFDATSPADAAPPDAFVEFIGRFGPPTEIVELNTPSRSDAWSTPVRIDELSTSIEDSNPQPCASGLCLWFAYNPGAARQLYRATRPDVGATWDPPQPVAGANDPADKIDGPWPSADESILYFTSTVSCGRSASS